jgi:hypothetical protein
MTYLVLFVVFASGEYSIFAMDFLFTLLVPTFDANSTSIGRFIYSIVGFVILLMGGLFSVFFALKREKSAFKHTALITTSTLSGLLFAAYITAVL